MTGLQCAAEDSRGRAAPRPKFFGEGEIEIGPIPTETSIGLLANLQALPESDDPVQHAARLLDGRYDPD